MRASMRLPVYLSVAAICLSLIGCGSRREDVERRLQDKTKSQLISDATGLWKKQVFSAMPTFVVLKSDEWPKSFRSLSPLLVSIYPDGVSMTLERDLGVESGLWLMPEDVKKTPENTGRARFEKISDRIYWYTFTS